MFNYSDDSFTLCRNPFPEEEINPGPYRLLRSSRERRKSEITIDDDTNIYRSGHPLAQKILEACRNKPLDVRELTFEYTASPKKISLLDPLVGTGGWLQLRLFSIESFETEEHLLLLGMTDDGAALDMATCTRFFSLDATEGGPCMIPYPLREQFDDMNLHARQALLDENSRRNSLFFDEEYEKLDKWAEDMKLGLETEIRDLDAEIRLRKSEVRKIGILEEKVRNLRLVKDLEKKRDEKRRHLFEAQDRIEARKDGLLEEIEARMRQRTGDESLFVVRWRIC